MLATRYRVSTRIMDGVQVLAYDVIDGNGGVHRFTKNEFDRLALNGQIENVHAQTSNGKIYIKGTNGLKLKSLKALNVSKQSNVDMRCSIRAKIKFPANRNIMGFIVECYDNSREVITTNQAKMMAENGKLKNARINKVKGERILRGVDCNLTEIPTITLSPEEFEMRLRNQHL